MELHEHSDVRTAMVLDDPEVAERVRAFPSLPVDHPQRFDESGELVDPGKRPARK